MLPNIDLGYAIIEQRIRPYLPTPRRAGIRSRHQMRGPHR